MRLLEQVAGSTVPSVVHTRNPLGQVVQARSPEVTYDYTFDAAHRLASVTDSRGNKQISYGYNRSGQRTVMIDSHGNRTDYRYDPSGGWRASGPPTAKGLRSRTTTPDD